MGCGSDGGSGGDETGGSTGGSGSSSADVTTTGSPSSSSGSPTATSTDPDSTSDDVTTASTTTTPLDVVVECFQCDLFMQDCADGERCVPWSCDGAPTWNGTRCSPIDPDAASVGEPCTMQDSPYSGLDDCQRAAMCWEVDESTLEGTCIGLCTGSAGEPGCADACAECLISAETVLALCVASCDPVMQDCDAEEGCYLADQAYVCAPTSAPDAMPGDTCESITDCAPGDTCVNGDFVPGCVAGSGCCTPFCSVGDPGGCDEVGGSVCTAVFPPGQGCVPDSTGICVEP